MAVKLGLLETAKYGFSAHLRTVEQELKANKAPASVLARLQKWCGIRDRSEQEARAKMKEILSKTAPPISSDWAKKWEEDWLESLYEDGYLDEARCAESYTRIHLEHKRWGPLKIKAGLRSRGVSTAAIDQAVQAVPDQEWQRAADELARRRSGELEEHRDRVFRWLLQRGFPQAIVWTAFDRLESGHAS